MHKKPVIASLSLKFKTTKTTTVLVEIKYSISRTERSKRCGFTKVYMHIRNVENSHYLVIQNFMTKFIYSNNFCSALSESFITGFSNVI